MDKTFKRVERKVAAAFGSQRTPLSGGNGKITRSDSLHGKLFIEAKLRQKHTAVTLWDQTAELAKAEGKIPVIALAERRRKGFWLMMHKDDLPAVAAALTKPTGDTCTKSEPPSKSLTAT